MPFPVQLSSKNRHHQDNPRTSLLLGWYSRLWNNTYSTLEGNLLPEVAAHICAGSSLAHSFRPGVIWTQSGHPLELLPLLLQEFPTHPWGAHGPCPAAHTSKGVVGQLERLKTRLSLS